jgi:sensor c-di-GMP phosphodiesterase-like protein
LIELHRAEPRLATLPAAGVASAIDGFGTGDSCLSYLSRLPVDVLKINKSFVDGLLTSEHHAALRKTIHDTSRSLDMKTIAEGVESAAQGDWLRGERCTFRPGLPVVAGS